MPLILPILLCTLGNARPESLSVVNYYGHIWGQTLLEALLLYIKETINFFRSLGTGFIIKGQNFGQNIAYGPSLYCNILYYLKHIALYIIYIGTEDILILGK